MISPSNIEASSASLFRSFTIKKFSHTEQGKKALKIGMICLGAIIAAGVASIPIVGVPIVIGVAITASMGGGAALTALVSSLHFLKSRNFEVSQLKNGLQSPLELCRAIFKHVADGIDDLIKTVVIPKIGDIVDPRKRAHEFLSVAFCIKENLDKVGQDLFNEFKDMTIQSCSLFRGEYIPQLIKLCQNKK